MSERRCEQCDRALPLGRADQRYCGTNCRTAACRQRRRDEREQERREWVGLTAHQAHALDSALAEERLLASVAHAARENWRASAWLLERRYPEHWAQRPREVEAAPPPDPDDPFREVDELAARRRER